MPSLKEQLTQILIDNNLITPEQLQQALEVQKKRGGRLSSIIVDLGYVKESQLISAVSEGLGLPFIDLKRIKKVDSRVLEIIPAKICSHYQILPISQIGDTLTIAMADPLNIFTVDALRNLTGFQINSILSTSEQVLQAIDRFYPDTTGGIIEGLLSEMSDSSIEVILEKKESEQEEGDLTLASQQGPAVRIANLLLEEGVKKKASDILIELLSDRLRVRFRIDGTLQEQKALAKPMHPMVVSRIKILSELDIAEHRLPQDGRFKLKVGGREVDFRTSILPSNLGEKVAVRILDKAQAVLDVDRLGFDPKSIADLKKSALRPHGMILVCGPTGSGKTTTLYSILNLVDNPQKNIVTVEDPVEFQLDGINQVNVRPDIGLTFALALRSILRQDPDVIMIGEVRDFDTVDIAIKAALTGHLVLSTLHTTTSSGAVVRLVNMGVEPYLITSCLICVVAQRLVRKLCPECKKKAGEEFFTPQGCGACANTGYSGRLGIAEVLSLSANIKDLILSRAQEHEIKDAAGKEGMKTLRENALELARQGLISMEEVLRVTAE